MRVSRIYVADDLIVGKRLELQDEAAHYVRTVLRLKKGLDIILFNGQGGEYLGRFEEVSRKKVVVDVLEFSDRSVESSLEIVFGLGISRGDRMDWAVQKAVELGVNHMTPLLTERCVIKFKDEEKKRQRLIHWRNIAQHAAEQSGRTLLPHMSVVDELSLWVEGQQGLRIFLDPYAKQSLSDLPAGNGKVTLLSGPEGGFSEQERDIAVQAGFIPVRLGQRILRTETAALAALSAVQTLWGDFSA
ncbi:16S rRNA (uracil(1498)-N(3))-methyltransferase [Methylomarinum sp. Ch1-1]|uniref:Ribosomal RNA small subunit methyltransferase E n=1 Tax=Methylomarinum roseum TaxID=3067653 RepID=A0AAU7NX16_9GAMM|nr:16S rRNA (uracil(1498)-N(3))-methyltransferase [Methylomarinum sp. Ch1-1]MDP4522462.1 16S rRNA (uracil(1498)-N(3))-methyltransferase [Methylomarinum sp. Ch1-1]